MKTLIKDLKASRPFIILMTPGVIFLILFRYLPMAGALMAFKDFRYKGGFFKSLLQSEWVGLKNFEFLFFSGDAFRITRNTVLYNLVFIVVGMLLSIIIAIAVNELRNKKLGRVYQAIYIIPFYISWVTIAYMFYAFLSYGDGFINTILHSFGRESVNWYTTPRAWPYIIIFADLWKKSGYQSVLFLAAIVGIPNELYEAAFIDGANKTQQIIRITVPTLIPMMIILGLMSIGKIFYADFGLFYHLPRNSGSLLPVTSVIDTYVFNALRSLGDLGMSSAAGFYQSIVGLFLVIFSNRFVKKMKPENALF